MGSIWKGCLVSPGALILGWFLRDTGNDGGRRMYQRTLLGLASLQSGGRLQVDLTLGGGLEADGSVLRDGSG